MVGQLLVVVMNELIGIFGVIWRCVGIIVSGEDFLVLIVMLSVGWIWSYDDVKAWVWCIGCKIYLLLE